MTRSSTKKRLTSLPSSSMSKLSREALTEAVQSELVTFLQSGTINDQRVAAALDFTELQIDDFDRLKRIHFCLSEPVLKFVSDLPKRIRRIKTVNQRQQMKGRGEVRGKIHWNQTIKQRYAENYKDRSVFVFDNSYTEYDIPENLVLKKLLWVIYETVTTDLVEIDYPWRTDRWTEDQVKELRRIYSRNVHLTRIQNGDQIELTARDLTAARTARYELYNDAYERYDQYQRLMENQFDTDILELFSETLVVPERIPRLFELFCVFKLIRELDRQFPGVTLQPIEPGASEIARLEDDRYRIEVYHDQQGDLQFYEPIEDIEPTSPFFRRHLEVLESHNKHLQAFTGSGSNEALYQGRPDIVALLYDKERNPKLPRNVLLGEIKYTDQEQTFSRGLKELIEYMTYARIGQGYLNEDPYLSVEGLLITDGVETAPSADSIQHRTAKELLNEDRSNQPAVLKRSA